MSSSRSYFRGGVVLLGVLGLLFTVPLPAATTAANLRKVAPDFTLADSAGHAIQLSSYRGKVVLLDFWATWCGGCKTEIPWYTEFQNSYKERGLSVVGVSMDDDGWKSVRPFLAEHKLNYPVVIGTQELGKKYGADSLPVTVLIDRVGRVAEAHSGVVDKDAFETDLRELLSEQDKDAGK